MQQPRQKPRGRNGVLTFAQSFRHKRTALAALAILLSILLREVLLWQQAHGTRVSATPIFLLHVKQYQSLMSAMSLRCLALSLKPFKPLTSPEQAQQA